MNRSHIASLFRAVAELAMHAEDHTRATLDDDHFDSLTRGTIAARVWAYKAVRREDLNSIRALCTSIERELDQ